jgi:hypothetical protein
MKTFQLKNNSGESMSLIKADSKKKAIDYFSKLKKLIADELLSIYSVEEK